mgnify:CR=1 FL=1
MIHFIFHLIYSLSLRGYKNLLIELFKTFVLYLVLICFFPLSISTSSEILYMLTIPISCVVILFIIILNISSLMNFQLTWEFIQLNKFTNFKNSLYRDLSTDWILINILSLWFIICSSLFFGFPLGLLLLQQEVTLNLAIVKVFFVLSLWILNQLFIISIGFAILGSLQKPFSLSCLISFPISIPFLLHIVELVHHINLGIDSYKEFMILILMSLIHLVMTPKIISFFINNLSKD